MGSHLQAQKYKVPFDLLATACLPDPVRLAGGGIIAPPGPGFPCPNGLFCIFPALNAAAEIIN